MLRVAAALLFLNGLGFGSCCIPALKSIAAGKGPAIVFGFPTYGAGPFERHGVPSTVPLIVAFLVVNLLEIAAGAWLLTGARGAAVLALALVPVGAVFWWGFALPVPWVLALARVALIVAAWGALR